MIEGIGEEGGVNYEDMIFSDLKDSICGGGDGDVDPNMCSIIDKRD